MKWIGLKYAVEGQPTEESQSEQCQEKQSQLLDTQEDSQEIQDESKHILHVVEHC